MPTSFPEAALTRIRRMDGLVLACFVDPATGRVVGAVQEREDLSVPIVAAGAGDVADTLSMMTGRLAAEDEFEDVIITLSGHFLLIRLVRPRPEVRLLLAVAVDRGRVSLARAHREVRDFCDGLSARFGQDPPPAREFPAAPSAQRAGRGG